MNENAGELRRWLICAAVVLAAHGGAASVLATWSEPELAGAPSDAIMLDLSPVAAAPSTEKTDVAPDQVDQKAEPLPPDPVEKVEKEDLTPPEPVEKVEQPKEEKPPEKPAEVTLPKPEPPKKKPPPKKRVAAINTKRAAADVQSPRETNTSAGNSGAARATFAQMIVAHLNRHKNYPSDARARHEEGTVLLSFTIDRDGRLLSGSVARSSGFSELDREALDMLRRAQPYPQPPGDLAGQRFPFTAPMRYYLR